MAVSFVSYTAGPSVATGNAVVPYPATVLAGDLLLLGLSLKRTLTTVTTPDGYTLIADVNIPGVGADASDSGPVRSIMYARIADGTESGGSFTLVTAAATGYSTGIIQYRNATGGWDLSAFTTEIQTTGTSPYTMVGDLGTAVVSTGDFLLYQVAINSDVFGLNSFTRSYPAGITSLYVERQDRGSTTGNDSRIVIGEAPITGGSNSGSFSISATVSGTPLVAGVSPFMAAILLRLKEAPIAEVFSVKNLGLLGVG